MLSGKGFWRYGEHSGGQEKVLKFRAGRPIETLRQ